MTEPCAPPAEPIVPGPRRTARGAGDAVNPWTRRRLGRALLAVLLLGAAGLVPSCGDSGRPPNVVFVLLDTLRRDHMSAYGYAWPTTPRLDELAARGALFTDCTSQASWTMPSMISIMTGRPIFTTIYKIPDECTLLAEHFHDGGWRTGAFVANSLVSSEAGFARGIEQFEIREKMTRQWTAGQVVDRALAFVDAGGDDDERPFFAWLHFLDTHDPYAPPTVPWQRTPDELFDEGEQAVIDQALADAPDAERPGLSYERDALAREVDRYDGELAYLDAQLGRLFDELARRGLLEDTYVVVVADHGETLFRRREHPDRVAELRAYKTKAKEPMRLWDYVKKDHDRYVYDELVRTPFLLAGPGVLPGQRVDALVSNLDVGPTLLGLCGLPQPVDAAGRDLSGPLTRGDAVPPARWVTSFCDSVLGARLPDGRKLVLPAETMQQRYGFEPRVYDLRVDPRELHPRPPDAEAELGLERLRQEAELDPFKRYDADGVDAETLAKLRELGYVR
ncbi:MAG: sulfatase-like hydrolase/transferase [Planctomycetes bacterium]|nr:sulfatase-like hydrolase/transferase [Planctomycetota bacterium]